MSQIETKANIFGKIAAKIVSFRDGCSGSLSVPFALSTIPLLVAAGSALDYSRAASFKSQLQVIVDSTALRAVSTSDKSWLAAANAALAKLDEENGKVVYWADGDETTVVASAQMNTAIMSILGITHIPVTAKARARIVDAVPACVLGLNQSDPGAVSFSGAAEFHAEDCVVYSNSRDKSGLSVSNNSQPVASGFCSAGGVSAPAGLKPNPRSNCRTINDPFENLPKPTVERCNGNGNGKRTSVGPGETAMLTPGTFCGGLNIQGTATLAPGVYVINDGELSINAQARLEGTGVTFYLTGSKSGFTFNGGASISVSAPTSGTYGGIVIFQDPDAVGANGRKIENTLNGGADTIINGAIYTKNQAIRINGSSGFGQNSRYMPVVADTVTITGSTRMRVDVEGVEMAAPLPMATEVRIVE
jgi:hypothetical protein